ncbi:Serine/threonine-protein phosphatase 2A regulatory subunit B'' subunit beta [Acropora cervicornis]|uniref:Serine/threonine-protein phosphatase 2A regulatory subunit B'' subunit beta n=1 Tax=Acropora cervicornis TaxID=6130 RepID=A0AAD9QS34_ACRCE|nr:Serine/threonine-protein phosphatase 2A regulatory subunit B'' subunit beta [Acropora cervicornis]
MTHLSPILKVKVDELFLRWLSMPDTQRILRNDLNKLIQGRPLSPRQLSPVQNTIGGARPISPPAPPTSSPTQLLRSPRSPRERTSRKTSSKSPPRSPRLENHDGTKNQMKDKTLVLNNVRIVPGCAAKLPQFYFPLGKPDDSNSALYDDKLSEVTKVFQRFDGSVPNGEFGAVAKACGLPLYWREPLFATAGGHKHGFVTLPMFTVMWKSLTSQYHDNASRFVRLLSTKHSSEYLEADDFIPLLQDIVETHPGLEFLREAADFHSRYVHTVIARIFYYVNSSWTGRITIPELRNSNFLEVLASLEDEEDINEIVDYFSYEHFYVIYCKFWELDTDHDLLIDEKDLMRHNNHALSSRIVKRLFSGCVTRGPTYIDGKMTYPEFVWFLLSEEDKKHPRSIEYWFRCMDMDGDGILSMYELEYFYSEQVSKMEALGIETMVFEDCLCQILDMVKPKVEGCIKLSDLKNCKLAYIFFNTFFNLDKYLEHEQRDPFAAARDFQDTDGPQPTDWERYAQEEYDLLVAEEGANEPTEGLYEDDFDEDEDLAESDIMALKGLEKDVNEENDRGSKKPWTMVTGIDGDIDDDDDDDDFY